MQKCFARRAGDRFLWNRRSVPSSLQHKLGWPLEACRDDSLAERAIGSSGTDSRFRAHSNTRTLVLPWFGVGSSGADGRFRYCSSSNSNLIPDAWSRLLCRHLEAPIIDARLASWVASAVSRLFPRSATLVYMGTNTNGRLPCCYHPGLYLIL